MSITTTAVAAAVSGTGFSVNVTACNLLADTDIKDFSVFDTTNEIQLSTEDFTKDSQTQITYTGASLGSINIEVRRNTPVARYQDITYGSKFNSSIYNEETDRILRRQAEFDTFGSGPTSSAISVEPLNQAYNQALWAADTTRGRTANVVSAEFELKADLASPTFTGTPTAPTAAASTNDTQIATTQFVQTELNDYATKLSPALTGTPTAPTAAQGTSTSQIATTSFVITEVTNYAPLASPTFTGVPAAPTPASNTDTTQIATTEFVTNRAIENFFWYSQASGLPAIVSNNWTTPAWAAANVKHGSADFTYNANGSYWTCPKTGWWEYCMNVILSRTSGSTFSRLAISLTDDIAANAGTWAELVPIYDGVPGGNTSVRLGTSGLIYLTSGSLVYTAFYSEDNGTVAFNGAQFGYRWAGFEGLGATE